jgi:hypothetical protein
MTPNLNEATSLVNSIPLVKESIPVLMKLANGSNPNIPSYMALGRLQQIKAMVEHSQQPQVPQGTVKQNLERSVANMGMMNGRQQQMQQNMMQQGITAPGPAPEGVPQPAPIPQPEQMQQQPQELMAAHGGILHAHTDPQMFNFAPGGIVAFAKEGAVEDKDKPKYYRGLDGKMHRIEDKSAADEGPGFVDQLVNFFKSSDTTAAEPKTENYRGLDGKIYTRVVQPSALDVIKQKMGIGQASDVQTAPTGPSPNMLMGASQQNALSRLPPATLNVVPPPDIPASEAAPASVVPVPKPKPKPAVVPAVIPAAPSATATTGQGIGSPTDVTDMKKLISEFTPNNPYISGIGTAYTAGKMEDFDQQKAIADKLALNESLGIGTYGKNRREQMAQRAKEFEGNRMSQLDRLISLGTAFSRPGARAGDVGQRSVEMNEAERDAREKFQTAQDALMATVELADEAIRTGNATSIVAAKEAHKKALQDYKMAGVDVAKAQATAQATAQQTGVTAATTVFGDQTHLAMERERTNAQLRIAKMQGDSQANVANIYAAATLAGHTQPSEQERFTLKYYDLKGKYGPEEAKKWMEEQKDIRGAFGGSRYEGPDTAAATEAKIIKLEQDATAELETTKNHTKDPTKKAAIQTEIDNRKKAIRAQMATATGDVPPPDAVKKIK